MTQAQTQNTNYYDYVSLHMDLQYKVQKKVLPHFIFHKGVEHKFLRLRMDCEGTQYE